MDTGGLLSHCANLIANAEIGKLELDSLSCLKSDQCMNDKYTSPFDSKIGEFSNNQEKLGKSEEGYQQFESKDVKVEQNICGWESKDAGNSSGTIDKPLEKMENGHTNQFLLLNGLGDLKMHQEGCSSMTGLQKESDTQDIPKKENQLGYNSYAYATNGEVSSLKSHWLSLYNTGIGMHACGGCDYKSYNKDTGNVLQKYPESVAPVSSAPCERTVAKNHHSTDPMLQCSNSEVSHKCDKCEFVTHKRQIFNRHLKIHCKIKEFICPECGKEFGMKHHFDAHIVSRHRCNVDLMKSVTHKILECPNCEYRTAIKSHLTYHMLQHTKNGFFYKCDTCDYVTYRKHTYKRHLKIHCKAKDHLCTDCGKEFKEKHHFDAHIVARHSSNSELMKRVTNKIHYCKYCDYCAVIATHLSQHMRKHKVQ